MVPWGCVGVTSLQGGPEILTPFPRGQENGDSYLAHPLRHGVSVGCSQ